jgi:chromosome segregation protein
LYLKKLSLFGFKSFASRVDLDFTPGLTGVVGPNGVGKSNIADAFRWALGEQSPRILRGSRMQDVIFAGSESRKGLGYAEVTLVFDNSDGFLNLGFDEVTVTRRLFRSGESEYILNGVPCRLKDIVDLFSGTGLGKESYSVVEQGKVDVILSARPQDRRAIFDEASGITRYRARKREAERKLVEVRADQLRVGDLVAELGRQLPVLRTQAEEAERWHQLSERLTCLEIDLLCHDLIRLSQRRTDVAARIEELERREHQCAAKSAECEAALELAKTRTMQAESAVEVLHVSAGQAAAASERESGRLKLVQERKRTLSERSRQVAEMSEAGERKRARLGDECDRLASQVDVAAFEGRDIMQQADESRSRLAKAAQARAAAEAEIEAAKSDLFDALALEADLRSRIGAIESSTRSGEARLARLAEQAHEKAAVRDNARREADALLSELEQLRTELAYAEKKTEDARISFARAQRGAEAAAERASEAEARVSSAAAAHSSIDALQRQYEGYGRAVRALLAGDNWRATGLLGTVADLIRVPREYETAVEAALGSQVQNIVASTAEAAERAVEFLKRNRAGRATFLPLDILRPSPIPTERLPKGEAGVIGLASDLVECAPRHQKAIQYLLGRVLVVKDLECGVRLSRKGLRLRMVTLEGDIVSAGGAITGGEAPDRRGGLLARSRRLEELASELESARAESERLYGAKVEAMAEASRLQLELEECERKRAQAELALGSLDQKSKLSEAEIQRLADELETLEFEAEIVKRDISALAAEAQSMTEQLRDSGARREELEKSLSALNMSVAGLREEEAREAERHSELAQEAAAYRERLSGLKTALARAREQLGSHDEELAQLREEKDRLDKELAAASAQIEAIQEAAAAFAREYSEAQRLLDEGRDERARAAAEVNEAELAARAARKSYQDAAPKLNAARIEEARLAAEYEVCAERLVSTYSIDEEDGLLRNITISSRAGAQTEIARLRTEIAEIGPVNHTAVEEGRKLAERHEFLKSQLRDLEAAQASLDEVVLECERTCEKKFLETFEAVREEFSKIFSSVFGGGTADLVLDDDDDPLECGIDIICQPPGKKLSSLLLMSRGERSLIAIALLFAIMRVNPSPVCLLDEIDSALDEANLIRFAQLLRATSQDVQLIVVTHRKRTMECADTLFGVTMEESGVSKVFSIRTDQQVS